MNDVFISYAHIDDQPLTEGQKGWISQFHRRLQTRLAQLLGQEPRVWRDPKLSGNDIFDETIVREFAGSKVLVSVLTPRYVRSEWCQRELQEFIRVADGESGLRVENKSRVFKVVKTPVPPQEMPPRVSELFSRLLGFEFFEVDPETGRFHEYDEALGPEARQHYFERIYDLAYEICQVLKAYQRRGAPPNVSRTPAPSAGKRVYLAESTSDLRAERDQVRREFQERGYEVLPDSPLPIVAEELAVAVRDGLQRADAAVHLVGARFGFVPEGAGESSVELQARLSAELAETGPLARFIWMPPGLVTDDDRQAAFVQALREGSAGMEKTELLAGSLEQLKLLVVKHLSAPPPEPPPAAPTPASSLRRIYLVCDQPDQHAIEPVEDFLYSQGFEVKAPIFEGDPAAFVAIHQENLKLCDAALIYFGQASAQWVEMKLMDLLKASGYGRPNPWLARAVYIAPPNDRRKERFRSHDVEVIRQTGEFKPELLQGFVSRLHTRGE